MADTSDARVRFALGGLEGLKVAGEDWLGESVRRAPIEEGTLRGSAELGFVINGRVFDGPGAYASAQAYVRTLARSNALRTMAAMVKFPEIYAAAQEYGDHFEHPLGGQARYLSSVLLERGQRYVRAAGLAAQRGLD
jgi:hypothetical protein